MTLLKFGTYVALENLFDVFPFVVNVLTIFVCFKSLSKRSVLQLFAVNCASTLRKLSI